VPNQLYVEIVHIMQAGLLDDGRTVDQQPDRDQHVGDVHRVIG